MHAHAGIFASRSLFVTRNGRRLLMVVVVLHLLRVCTLLCPGADNAKPVGWLARKLMGDKWTVTEHTVLTWMSGAEE